MKRATKAEMQKVRTALLTGIRDCGEVSSAAALAALIELTVDSALAITGKRSLALECISEAINIMMPHKADYE